MIQLPTRPLAVLLTLALLAPLALPATGRAPEGEVPAGSAAAPVEVDRNSPRSTARGFLEACRAGDFELAARFLDLSGSEPAAGPLAARRLYVVLDRTLWVDLEALSDAPEGDPQDAGEGIERLKGTAIGAEPPSFELVRLARDGSEGWYFAARTVAQAAALHATYGESPIEELLPLLLVEEEFLEIRLWQWGGLALLVIGAYLAAWILAAFVVRVVRPLVARSHNDLDDRLLSLTVPPLRLLATVALFQAGMPFLVLKVPAVKFFDGASTVVAVVGVTWLVFRGVDLFANFLRETMERRGQASAVYLVPLGARTLKATVGVLTVLAALDNLGFDVTTIVAGLGVGGLAVALALRPTLENVFGGVTVLIDQPVKPGEFCRYGDKLGTVEDIGIRSTRIRSLDRTVVTVANADFSSMQIENFARRDRVRLLTTLGLRYETSADQLRHVIGGLRRLIHSHPRLYEDPRRVRFSGFGACSLDVEILCYVDTRDYAEFLAVREDIFLRIIDLVDASGTGFAFPSTTIYRAEDGGLDLEKARAAEAQVAAWREQGDLMFPEFSAEEQAALRGSIAYPAEGAAQR